MIPTLQFDRFIVRMHYSTRVLPHREFTDSVVFADRSPADGYYNLEIRAHNYNRIELIGCNGNAETVLHTWRKSNDLGCSEKSG